MNAKSYQTPQMDIVEFKNEMLLDNTSPVVNECTCNVLDFGGGSTPGGGGGARAKERGESDADFDELW